MGYTDRVVRAFRWEDLSENSDHISGQLLLLKKWLLEGQVRKQDVQSRTCLTVFKSWLSQGKKQAQNHSPINKAIVMLMT